MRAGDVFYVAHPDEVERVTFVHDGTDRHHKRKIIDPVTVRSASGEEWTVPRSALRTDMLAAAIESAEMMRKIEAEG